MEDQKPTREDFDRLLELKQSYSPFCTTLKDKSLNRPNPGKQRDYFILDIYEKLETIQNLTIKFTAPTKTLRRELWDAINSALSALIEPDEAFSIAFSNVSSLMEIVQKNDFVNFEPTHNVWLNSVIQKLPYIDFEISEIVEIIEIQEHNWSEFFDKKEETHIDVKKDTGNNFFNKLTKGNTE